MPTLPTLTINDTATWNRLLAAFNSDPAAYKAWLKDTLTDYVVSVEARRDMISRRTEVQQQMDSNTT